VKRAWSCEVIAGGCCRFALALFFDSQSLDLQALLSSQTWRSKYEFSDPIVRYLSIENFKFSPYGVFIPNLFPPTKGHVIE